MSDQPEDQLAIGEKPGEFVVLIEAHGIRGKMKVAARFDDHPGANEVEKLRSQVSGLFRRTYADWPSERLAATVSDQTTRPTTFRPTTGG